MEMAALKEIVAIKSADGCYFVIGKNEQGFFLKNKYTKIPNEFHLYNDEEVKELFQDLCDRVEECVPVSYPSGHPNSCMYVIYSDKSVQLYKEQRGVEKNLCAYTSSTASYSC